MSDLFEMLAAPFDPSEVDWRVGSVSKKDTPNPEGMALAYVDARTVMDRLDTVCGPAGWQNRYVMEGTKTVCEIGILCGDAWVWKADGAGDSDVEAEKGALSDAFKRAAVRWGIGRYLYNIKSPWVKVKPFGTKSFVIHPDEKKNLEDLLRRQMPAPHAKLEAKPEAKKEPTKAEKQLAAENFANQFVGLIAAAKSERDIDDVYAKNAAKIAKLKEGYLDLYNELNAIMDSHRNNLKKMEAAE